MTRAEPLKKGDKVGLLAPAGPAPAIRVELGKRALEKLGLQVVTGSSCYEKHGYLAGKDDIRAADIHAFFEDSTVRGIFSLRGGYGCQRLLPLLDYEMIKRHPKVFSGYSDITSLHIVFNQFCDLITYHGPMAATELYRGLDPYSMLSFTKNFFGSTPVGEVKNPNGEPLVCLIPGIARGRLTGGNLSLVASSLGTPYEIHTKDKILFLEEVDEAPYRIDRMLLQLVAGKKISDCAGLLLGRFTNCFDKEPENNLSLRKIISELGIQDKPILGNLACGHSCPTLTLPLGEKIELDTEAKTIRFL